MPSLSKRLREIRRQLGLKQGQLAEAIGVTQGTISRWETGDHEPDLSVMIKVAELAGLDPSEFISSEPKHPFKTGRFVKFLEVVGSVSEGDWNNKAEWDQEQRFEVTIPSLDRWDGRQLEGFYIKDESYEPTYKKGSVVFSVKSRGHDLEPKDKDLVIVERKNEKTGLFEVTIRRMMKVHRDHTFLTPLSDDPLKGRIFRISNHIEIDRLPELSGIEPIEKSDIRGVIVASFRIDH